MCKGAVRVRSQTVIMASHLVSPPGCIGHGKIHGSRIGVALSKHTPLANEAMENFLAP